MRKKTVYEVAYKSKGGAGIYLRFWNGTKEEAKAAESAIKKNGFRIIPDAMDNLYIVGKDGMGRPFDTVSPLWVTYGEGDKVLEVRAEIRLNA